MTDEVVEAFEWRVVGELGSSEPSANKAWAGNHHASIRCVPDAVSALMPGDVPLAHLDSVLM